MNKIMVFLFFFLISANSFAANSNQKNANNPTRSSVIDIGQLEIEGEIRRPQVTWIDSQKRVNGMLPVFHRSEFLNLEKQLLKPISKTEALKILNRSSEEAKK